jgi:glycosyltransferase involved in cell wall biosynthesis
MRIGVNALYLIPGGVGGTEIYLRSLLEAIRQVDRDNEWIVFTNRETGSDLGSSECRPQPVSAANRPARILWEQTRLPAAAARERLDVLFNPGFTAPLICPCPQVTVFHDMQHKRHPEYFRWFDLPAWRALLFGSACVSDQLIAVSRATRSDLLRYYPLPSSKVSVVEHGVDARMFEIAKQRSPQPYLLCVSTLHPHKNIERLVRVFARWRSQRPEWRLVLAGMRGFHTKPVERLVAELRLNDAVRITGWVDREELYELYRCAGAFVYPSTFEGFGMPVVEAMAAGLPLACSDIEPLRSVAGGCAVLFDPLSDESMHAAIESLIENPPAGGPRRAREFSWEAAAQATLAVLVSAADLRAGSSRRSSHRDT